MEMVLVLLQSMNLKMINLMILTQKKLLSKYTTQAKLARAKFLAFMEDSGEGEGVISWNELSIVHEDVGKFIYKEETGNELPVTPTLGQLEPRKGDWKTLPGATRIGYVVWDGDEWKYSAKRGKNSQKWIGGVEDYKDIDGYYLVTDNYTLYYDRDEIFLRMEALAGTQ